MIVRGEAKIFQLNSFGKIESSEYIGKDSLGSPVVSEEGAPYYTVTSNDIGGRSRLGAPKTGSSPSGSWPQYGYDQSRSGRKVGV